MRRHKTEEIVAKLRHAEGLAAGGRRISECVQEIGVTEVTYYRWRKRYGGIESDLAEYLTELETEIIQLRRLVSDLTLEKLILVEATREALSPALRAAYVLHAQAAFGISERRACQALGQHRSTQRKIRARLLLEAPPAMQCHSTDARSQSTIWPIVGRRLRDGTIRGALDSARSERADAQGIWTPISRSVFGRHWSRTRHGRKQVSAAISRRYRVRSAVRADPATTVAPVVVVTHMPPAPSGRTCDRPDSGSSTTANRASDDCSFYRAASCRALRERIRQRNYRRQRQEKRQH